MTYLLEHWKPIVGWEDVYEVSNTGRVRRIAASRQAKAWAIIKGSQQSRGYWTASLTRANNTKRYYVHRLVCAAFIGLCPDGMEVNHIDANKLNNRLSNLEYLSHTDNMKHAHGKGIFRKDFKRKLEPNEIRQIRDSDLSLSCGEVGAIHNVSKATVSRIRRGEAWIWIE